MESKLAIIGSVGYLAQVEALLCGLGCDELQLAGGFCLLFIAER